MPERFNPLETKYPIWNAGMGGGLAGPELVASVSESGCFGVLGTGGLASESVGQLIKETRQLTSRPFGANIILPMSDGQDVAICFDEGVEVLVLFWGDPQPFIKDAHKRGISLVIQCGNVEEAVYAASCGADAIIIQGTEAGGHVKGELELQSYISEIQHELRDTPLIAAGGIDSGKKIANLIKQGVQAVSLGTRFVASTEARATTSYKEKIVSSSAGDTVLTKLYDMGWKNAKHRVIKTPLYESWHQNGCLKAGDRTDEGETIGQIELGSNRTISVPKYSVFPPVSSFKGNEDELPFYAGKSVDGIHKIEGTRTIVETLVRETKSHFERYK